MSVGLRNPARLVTSEPDLQATAHHVGALDGLRAVAVLLVFGLHGFVPGFIGGYVGVDIFFVLSGFLITQLLLRQQQKTGRIDLARFYANRWVRLAPALFVMLVCFAVYAVLVLGMRPMLDEVVPALTYVTNLARSRLGHPVWLGHTWSLGLEEQFYVVWPLGLIGLLRLRLGLRGVRAGLLLVLLAMVAWRFWLFQHGAAIMRVYDGFDTHGDGLIVGCLLATAGASLRARVAAFWPLGVAVLAFVVVAVPWTTPVLYQGGLLLIALAAASVIAAACSPGMAPAWVLAWGPLRWLGRISYGAYLWHYTLLGMVLPYMGRSAILVFAPAAIGAAWLSAHFVEQPLRARRDSLPDGWRRIATFACPGLLAVGVVGLGVVLAGR
jgi:peptidoglycan/LPS O-acetylase OafA/YrhL